MADRQALHAYLSPDAHKAWETFAESNGVSITGLLESRGLDLMKLLAEADDPTDVDQDWVKAGRKVDASRRRRSRVA